MKLHHCNLQAVAALEIWGIEGTKCGGGGGKIQKLAENGWFLAFFSFWLGQVGEEPPMGGGNALMPPWCCNCLQVECTIIRCNVQIQSYRLQIWEKTFKGQKGRKKIDKLINHVSETLCNLDVQNNCMHCLITNKRLLQILFVWPYFIGMTSRCSSSELTTKSIERILFTTLHLLSIQ